MAYVVVSILSARIVSGPVSVSNVAADAGSHENVTSSKMFQSFYAFAGCELRLAVVGMYSMHL